MHTYCDGLKSALWPCSPEIWFQGSGFLLCRHTSRSVSRETLTRPAGSLHTAAQLPVWNEYLSSFSWHSGSPFQITTVICLFKKKIKKIKLWLHKLKLFKHTYRSIAGLLIICFLCDGAAASCTEATRHVSLPKQLFLMLVPVTAKQS